MKKKLVVAIAMMIMMVMAFAGTAFAAYTDIEQGVSVSGDIPVRHGIEDTAGAKYIFKAPADGIYAFEYNLYAAGDLSVSSRERGNFGASADEDIYSPESPLEIKYAIYLEKGDVEKVTIYSNELLGTENAKYEVTVKQIVTPETELSYNEEGAYLATADGNVKITLETYGEKYPYFKNEELYPFSVSSTIDVTENDYVTQYDLLLEIGKDYVMFNEDGNFFDFYDVKVGTGTMNFKILESGLAKILNVENGREINYTIVPGDVTVKSVTAGTGKITVKADRKVSATGASKYKIAYRVKGTKTWKYVTTTSQTKTIKNLKKGKTYQVKIKAIKTVKDVPFESEWSKVKTSAKVK